MSISRGTLYSNAAACVYLRKEDDSNGSADADISTGRALTDLHTRSPWHPYSIPQATASRLVEDITNRYPPGNAIRIEVGINSISTRQGPPTSAVTVLRHGNASFTAELSIGWNNFVLFTDRKVLDLEKQMRLAVEAVESQENGKKCSVLKTERDKDRNTLLTDLVCDFDIEGNSTIQAVISKLKNHLFWEQTPHVQKRYFSYEADVEQTCPYYVLLSVPLLNMLPLTIVVVILFAINVVISRYRSHCRNVFVAGFHIVREALGHDTTSNPLEENVEREEIKELKLVKRLCRKTGMGHVGFLARKGDVVVDEFDADTVVGGCTLGAEEVTEVDTTQRESESTGA